MGLDPTPAREPASFVSLDGVLITPELERRPSRQPDHERQARALDVLATALAEAPGDALQELVEVVVELCDAGSAGISLAEVTDGSPIFRWVAVAGDLGEQRGGTMPLDASPCGVVVERNAALLFARPGQHFPLANVDPPISEILLVPLHAGGRPIGTLWAIAHDPERQFDREDVRLLLSLSRLAGAMVQTNGSLAARDAGEALGRQILDSATDYAIIATDLDGRVTRWNEGAGRILGWEEAEMLGQPLHRIFTPDHVAAGRVEAEMREALAAGRCAADLPQVRRSGAHFPASCALTPLRDDQGQAVGFVKVLRDRSEERRREARLALLARASAGLLEAPDPGAVLGPLLEEGAALLRYEQAYVYSITPDGTQLALTHSVGVGERARVALACVPFDGPLCGIVAETGRPLVLTHLLATTEPRYAPGRAAGLDAYAGYPIFADGRVVAVIAFGSRVHPAFAAEELDVFATLARLLSVVRERVGREALLERRIEERTAELRERDEQLRQSQKMEAIGQLTGGLAHDVNNMLQGIGGALQIMQKRIAAGRLADLPRLFDAAQEGVDRAAALTHGLLAFARRGRLEVRPVVMDALVADMADLVRRTVGPAIEVRLHLGDGSWAARLDPNGLQSALLNLAINARDAMPEGGVLTFSTAEVRLTAADLGADAAEVAPGDFLLVGVSDTGIGMTPNLLTRIFEPFFTTKPTGQGTGLGLSQVYGFVRQSGGIVRVESAPGQGTTFRLLFPRAIEPAEAAEADAPADPLPAHEERRTILLVEDEATVRASLAEALRDRGHAVLEAGDGPAGLGILEGTAHVDLLVTDVGLPGLNGRQLAEAARQRRPTLPVLYITGYAGSALDGPLPPGTRVIAKPFTLDDLTRTAAAMLLAGNDIVGSDG